MILKENLRIVQMKNVDDVTTHPTRIQSVRDELVAVGKKPRYDDLVCTKLNGFTKEWCTYTLPRWEHLWIDFTQEELRLKLAKGITNKNGKVMKMKEEQGIVTLARKGKVNKGRREVQDSKGEKKKDLLLIFLMAILLLSLIIAFLH